VTFNDGYRSGQDFVARKSPSKDAHLSLATETVSRSVAEVSLPGLCGEFCWFLHNVEYVTPSETVDVLAFRNTPLRVHGGGFPLLTTYGLIRDSSPLPYAPFVLLLSNEDLTFQDEFRKKDLPPAKTDLFSAFLLCVPGFVFYEWLPLMDSSPTLSRLFLSPLAQDPDMFSDTDLLLVLSRNEWAELLALDFQWASENGLTRRYLCETSEKTFYQKN